MKSFVTADLHLNHGNIIKYSNRPFLNEFEIKKYQIELEIKKEISSLEKQIKEVIDTHGKNSIIYK